MTTITGVSALYYGWKGLVEAIKDDTSTARMLFPRRSQRISYYVLLWLGISMFCAGTISILFYNSFKGLAILNLGLFLYFVTAGVWERRAQKRLLNKE